MNGDDPIGSLSELYQEVILDHYRKPRNFGMLRGADRKAEGHNPLCGDRVALQGNLDPGALFGTPASIRARVAEIVAAGGPVGHVFNLGHGVLPETDPDRVRVMIEAVRACASR